MNIRPKTIRRLVILLAACVLIVAAARPFCITRIAARPGRNSPIAPRGWTHSRPKTIPSRSTSFTDMSASTLMISTRCSRSAVSRGRVETANGRHLADAKAALRAASHRAPDNIDVSHHLLQLYEQIDYLTEAQRVAKDVLDRDPNDVEALRVKAEALARSNKYADALAVSQKLNEVAPLDLDGQMQTLDLMSTMKRPKTEIMAHYQQLQAAHPGDPRFEFLIGLAALSTDDQPTALKWLRQAAHAPLPTRHSFRSSAGVSIISSSLMSLAQLLERASANGNHPDIEKILIQRFWQNGKYQEVVDRLKDLDASSPSADADLLAFKALALIQLDRKSDADAIVAALKSRTTSSKATAWAIALAARYDSNLGPLKAIDQYQSALSRDRENAVIRSWMGEAYMQLGEIELAMQEWRQASALMPSWAHPGVLLARAELKRGQTDQALQHAADSLRRAHESGRVRSRGGAGVVSASAGKSGRERHRKAHCVHQGNSAQCARRTADAATPGRFAGKSGASR